MITLKKLLERVKDGKVDPLSKMGKQKLTGREISNYYKDNPDQKKAARDKDVKIGIELALDLSGAQSYAVKELEKFKRGLSKHPAVKKALQHANESVSEEHGAGDFGTDKLRKKYEKDTPTESVTEAVADITVDPRNKINSGQQQGYFGMEIAKQARRMGLKSAVMHKHVRIKGGKKQINDFLRLVIGKSRYGDPTEKDMTTPQIDKMLNKGMKGKNEMKEGRDLSEFTSLNEGNNIPKIKEIVAKKQATKIQGVMVDMFTASLISQIYDKVSDANKKKMEKMTVARLADAAYKIMKKQSVHEAVSPAQQAAIAISKKEKGEKPKNECADEKDFKPHMMYDPKTGKGYMAKTYDDHVRMDKMGYTHEKPEVKENRARRDAMRGMSRDKDFMDKDDDDMVASPDDRKAADKNPLIQLRRIADLPKGGDMEFKDGKKKKISQKDAQKALKGFSALRKNPDKLKYQTMVGKSHSDLKRILKLIK